MKTEKLYLASTGREVTVGDQIRGLFCKDGITSAIVITLSDAVIPMLKDAGILVTTPPRTKMPDAPSVSSIIQRIADRTGWKPQKVEGYLNAIDAMMPMAAFNIVLREVAIMLDQKYPDHINKSKRIFCISPLDGRIHEVCKAHIKNYRNFAAFRSVEDAKLACNFLRKPLKEMFKSGE